MPCLDTPVAELNPISSLEDEAIALQATTCPGSAYAQSRSRMNDFLAQCLFGAWYDGNSINGPGYLLRTFVFKDAKRNATVSQWARSVHPPSLDWDIFPRHKTPNVAVLSDGWLTICVEPLRQRVVCNCV